MHPIFNTIEEIKKTIAESEEICKTFQSLQSIWLAKDQTDSNKFESLIQIIDKKSVINSKQGVPMNKTIRDAFCKTESGKTLVVEVESIKDRIRSLKQLVHDTFLIQVPNGYRKRFDFYQKSKPVIKKLATIGGEAYKETVQNLKFAYVSKESYKAALKSILPPKEKEGKHNFKDYESSDIYTR